MSWENCMEIKTYNKIDDLKSIWNEIYKKSKQCPILEFDFVKNWNKTLKQKKALILKRGKIKYYVGIENGKAVMILPMIKYGNTLESVYLLDYFDVLSEENIEPEKVKEFINKISETTACKILFNHVNENSVIVNTFKEAIKKDKFEECSVILLNPSSSQKFDEFYNKLSKNTRQNIRTMYNRISKDGIEFSLLEIDKSNYKKHQKTLKKLYVERRKNRYKNIGFILRTLYKHKEPILDTLSKLDFFKGYAIQINGKIVSYLAGTEKDGVLYVPRLVIGGEYSRYSTGILLLCEIIKNSSLKYIDLSTGSEDYKHSLNCVVHNNYFIEL